MDTSFRDGFQSVFGSRVVTRDFLPALDAAVDAGTRYFEAGGGARFQSLFFYCNESAFDMMDSFREKAGPDADLQTLAGFDPGRVGGRIIFENNPRLSSTAVDDFRERMRQRGFNGTVINRNNGGS
ncbi:uncharacterized protein METZ01_LOCUS237166 [marine metagenome]|uniref:Uncharacterized protein n=1 Tax=marine metagenome TaxID=408172 RepID=A0A382HAW5_9ZZZZ